MLSIKDLFQKDLFLLDGDGTLYVGSKPTPKAGAFLKLLEGKGKRYMIITNNSSYSTTQHAKRISKILKHKVRKSQVIVSTSVAVNYLLRKGVSSVYALGVPAFKQELKLKGIKLKYRNPELVLVGFDKTLTYRKLTLATRLIMSGIPYIATHPDILCPVANGYIPDIGAILAFLEAATGKKPEAIVGKPNRLMIDYALEVAKTSIDRTVLFGDRLYTDIKMANEVGMDSVLVLTGETKTLDMHSQYRPSLIINSFEDILKVMES